MPRFRLVLGIGAQAMQQLTGINVLCYYLPYVLTESVGLKGSIARIVSAFNALAYLLATLVGWFTVDRWGRRRLLYLSAVGHTVCWMTITVLLHFADEAAVEYSSAAGEPPLPSPNGGSNFRGQVEKCLSSASVVFFFVFNIFFGAGWQGVSWLYPTEINSTQMRTKGMSFGVTTNWLINFAVVLITPLGIARMKAGFYTIWTVLNAFIGVTVWLFYPETSNRSLEHIDTMFESHNTIWAWSTPEMTSMRRRNSANLLDDSKAEHASLSLESSPET